MRDLKILVFILPIFIILYSYYPLIQAKWAVIDDHEIVNFIGNQTYLPLADIPQTLNQTEIGVNHTAPRFRPTYYGLRVAFSSLIGHQPGIWHALQILIILAFTVALTKICLLFASPLITLGFVCFAISQPYLSDSISRLGPGENYAILGVSLVMYGGLRAYKKSKWGITASLLIFFGILFAAGSKENFLILGLLPLWILFSSRNKAPLFAKITSILSLAYIIWITSSIINRLSIAQADVYGNSTSAESRIKLVFNLIQRPDFLIWLIGTLIIFQLIKWIYRHYQIDENDRLTLIRYCWVSISLLGLYSFQYIFYAGKWPDIWGDAYYSFPGAMAKELAILLMILAVIKITTIWFALTKKTVYFIFLIVTCIYLTLSLRTLNHAHQISTRFTVGSQQYDKKLQELFSFLRDNPSASIYLNYPSEIDFEPNASLERFIRAAGFKNPIFATTKGVLSPVTTSSNLINNSKNCFAIGMNGPATSPCQAQNYISYFWGPPPYKE